MRKQFLTAAAVLAAMALGASTASATPPDFPHNDLDSDNWAAVAVDYQPAGDSCDLYLACEFASDSADWYWRSNPSAPPYGSWWDYCRGSIEGEIYGDGSVEITGGSLWGPMNRFCDTNELHGFPLAGQMCSHIPTGETWLRQNLQVKPTYGSPTPLGVTFGEIADGYQYETLTFDMTDAGITHHAPYGTYIHDAEFTIGDGVFEVLPPEEAAPCSWAELDA